jgi:oligoendopeptidase F
MSKLRSEVETRHTWDLSSFFKGEDEFLKLKEGVTPKINELRKFNGKLNKDNALDCLKLSSSISRDIERLYVYAYAKRDEDTTVSKNQAQIESVEMLSVEFSETASFISPTLNKLPLSVLNDMLSDKNFANFSMEIKGLIRSKKHILSAKEEAIMSGIRMFSKDFKNNFTMFDNADITFESVKNENGEDIPITH